MFRIMLAQSVVNSVKRYIVMYIWRYMNPKNEIIYVTTGCVHFIGKTPSLFSFLETPPLRIFREGRAFLLYSKKQNHIHKRAG